MKAGESAASASVVSTRDRGQGRSQHLLSWTIAAVPRQCFLNKHFCSQYTTDLYGESTSHRSLPSSSLWKQFLGRSVLIWQTSCHSGSLHGFVRPLQAQSQRFEQRFQNKFIHLCPTLSLSSAIRQPAKGSHSVCAFKLNSTRTGGTDLRTALATLAVEPGI